MKQSRMQEGNWIMGIHLALHQILHPLTCRTFLTHILNLTFFNFPSLAGWWACLFQVAGIRMQEWPVASQSECWCASCAAVLGSWGMLSLEYQLSIASKGKDSKWGGRKNKIESYTHLGCKICLKSRKDGSGLRALSLDSSTGRWSEQKKKQWTLIGKYLIRGTLVLLSKQLDIYNSHCCSVF